MQSTMEECVLFLGHSFVRRMKEACGRGAMCGVQHRYYTRDLYLSNMFRKVVLQGRGGLTVDGLFRELLKSIVL